MVVLSLQNNFPFLPLWVAAGCSDLIFTFTHALNVGLVGCVDDGFDVPGEPATRGNIAGQGNRLLVYEHISQTFPDAFCVVGQTAGFDK